MSGKTSLQECADKMAEAIREWNRAKLERESWQPVPGQVPPVGILGSAKKANAMLAKALDEYEAFQQSVQSDGATPWVCPVCLENQRAEWEVCHSCGTPRR